VLDGKDVVFLTCETKMTACLQKPPAPARKTASRMMENPVPTTGVAVRRLNRPASLSDVCSTHLSESFRMEATESGDTVPAGAEQDGAVESPRLLLVEDDPSLREAIRAALSRSGYKVRAEADGTALNRVLADFHPDLAILDVRFPRGDDGFALARVVRAAGDAPVLFVTAADGLDDRLRGFDVGGDDYLVKPFAMAELLARVRALLRRAGRLSSPTIEIYDLVIDETNRTVHRGDAEIVLGKVEFELLAVLAREPGRVFSRAQLLTRVWGFEGFQGNLVEVHVSALRRKLEAHGGRIIHTERGHGYVIRPPLPG
jgi:two-component system OmpR family response regulator